jgi:hypothetical protein
VLGAAIADFGEAEAMLNAGIRKPPPLRPDIFRTFSEGKTGRGYAQENFKRGRADLAQVATRLLNEGKAVRDIARTFNVHEATIYRLAAAS